MKIAITSTDGVHVNEHFGMARKFYIYEYEKGHTNFLEKRKAVEMYSIGDKTHRYDEVRFVKILHVINDCQVIFTKKIGKIPFTKLKQSGIEPVTFEGDINDVLKMLPKSFN